MPLFLASLLVALAAFAAASYWTQNTVQPTVSTLTVQRHSFTLQIHERGTVRPARVAPVKSLISSNQAKLVWMHEEGQMVKRGQIVARFDTKPFNDALITAEQSVIDSRTRINATEKALQLQREDNTAKLEAANRKREIALIKSQDLREGTGALERQRRTLAIDQAQRSVRIAMAELADFDELFTQGHVSQRERDKVADVAQQMREQLAMTRAELDNFDRYERPRLTREAELLVDAAETEVARVRRVAGLELNRWESELLKHRRDLRVAEQQLAKARRNLENCDVRAPIDGILFYVEVPQQRQRRKAQTGDAIWIGQTFMEIPDTSELKIELRVREVDIARLAPGMPARVEFDALPDRGFSGTLRSVGSLAERRAEDSVQRYNAEVRISDPSPDLRVGMSANIQIAYKDLHDVIAVPVSAIEYRDGDAWVQRQESGRAVPTKVTLGDVGLELVEVTAGLSAGDRIVIGAQ
ncbi:MAG: efflux RND transporter periplasmic adaptor subunit [Gammaproteobacteria bacterium]|nr:efflux RND transporter periplasmic adaptor subunit [Gammaproteobacteria bacterium]